jgi:hypothetical protein
MGRAAGRQPMCGADGRWSFRQAAAAAGVPFAVARRLAAIGLVNQRDLSKEDITLLRLAAALDSYPGAEDSRRDSPGARARDLDALGRVEAALRAGQLSPETLLLVTPTEARLMDTGNYIAELATASRTDDGLVLHVGRWAAAKPTTREVAA